MPGQFITLEGVEGAGKSSALQTLENCLKQADIPYIVTREPGGTELGEQIRQLLLNPENTAMHSNTELLLMFAARAQHLSEKIQPALDNGTWVICDRFTDATYAYQGGGRGIEESRIQQLEHWVQQGLTPDFTLLLDLPVEIGLQRAMARGAADRFEAEKVSFFEKVRQCYLQRAERFAKQYRIIDASQALDDVQSQITQTVSEYIQVKIA